MDSGLTVSIVAIVVAAGLKLIGDTFEMHSKTEDMERRPKTRKALLNAKTITTCVAALVAFVGALCLMFEGMAIFWAGLVTLGGMFILTLIVYFWTLRETEVDDAPLLCTKCGADVGSTVG